MLERRRALGGSIPARRTTSAVALKAPEPELIDEFLHGTKESQAVSTTMAFVRLLRKLMKDKSIGPRVVPIVPDEARTFGMDPLFAEFGIYASQGQKYTPVDADYVLKYHESESGQLLEEGITEAGSLADFIAAASSYSSHGQPMIPFYMFYSMFGFQRVGDLVWAAADQRCRGFLCGATAGRTTLMGEGLQHDDGQSPLLASVVPSCRIYDPAFAFESAVIVRDGLHRMIERNEDWIYYITLYNETYRMPAMPQGAAEGILRGLYLFRPAPEERRHHVRILGSGPLMNAALRAQEILATDYGVAADVWSATSYSELRREALECDRWNRLHPARPAQLPYVAQCLPDVDGPIIAVSDYVKAVPDLIARWLPRNYHVLGTDGFGRSDTRDSLRRFFETDHAEIVVTALSALARDGQLDPSEVKRSMDAFGLDAERPDPGHPELPSLRAPADPGKPVDGNDHRTAGTRRTTKV
jgi:pyruvate dehydrogenase E1 component